MGSNKQVKFGKHPKGGKNVRIAVPPDFNQYPPLWHFRTLDVDGPFAPKETYGWRTMTAPAICDMLEKLGSLETMTWAEILRAKKTNHLVATDQLCLEAQSRLEAIGREACDTLYSLGPFGNLPRLWGIREGMSFQILWWDPDHRVCPSTRKDN